MNPEEFYKFINSQFLPFLNCGTFQLFGGILRKYMELSDMDAETQKDRIKEYLQNGGDIDVYTRRINLISIEEYGRFADMIEPKLRKKIEPHELVSAHLNMGYFGTNNTLKMEVINKTKHGKNINVKVDLVEEYRDSYIKFDFDVNSLILPTKISEKIDFSIGSRANIDMELIRTNILNRTCQIVNPVSDVETPRFLENSKTSKTKNMKKRNSKRQDMIGNTTILKRIVKIFNNGYTIDTKNYDEVCCSICPNVLFDDIDELDADLLVRYILNPRLSEFIKKHKNVDFTERSILSRAYCVYWPRWLVTMIVWSLKANTFDTFRPFVKHFSDFNCENSATLLFERIANDHFDIYKWVMNEIGYGHHRFYSVDLKHITSNDDALEYMHGRVGNFDIRVLELATYSSFETFQFVLSRISKRASKIVDWNHMSRVSVLGDYRTMKWIKDNKGIDPELDDNFWENYRNSFRFELYNFVSKEMYSDQFMHRVCKKFIFTPAVLTLEGIASRINPIFIEWYLGLHYEKMDSKDMMDMFMILDILIDYNRRVVLDFTIRYNMNENLKEKLLDRIGSHETRIKDVMIANVSFNEANIAQSKIV